MRFISVFVLLMMLASTRVARGQSFELYGAAGPTLVDAGNSLAVGGGFSPTSRTTVLFTFERTQLSTRFSRNGDAFSIFRGGTFYLGSAEIRVAPLGRHRIGPYGLAGLAAGVSRPNVNQRFPGDAVTNSARAAFAGGGLQIPFRDRFAFFADARMMFGVEGNEGIVAVAPLRAGIAWRF